MAHTPGPPELLKERDDLLRKMELFKHDLVTARRAIQNFEVRISAQLQISQDLRTDLKATRAREVSLNKALMEALKALKNHEETPIGFEQFIKDLMKA